MLASDTHYLSERLKRLDVTPWRMLLLPLMFWRFWTFEVVGTPVPTVGITASAPLCAVIGPHRVVRKGC